MKLRFTCDDGSVISHLPHLNGGCTVSPAFFFLFTFLPYSFCMLVQVGNVIRGGKDVNKLWRWTRRLVCMIAFCRCRQFPAVGSGTARS